MAYNYNNMVADIQSAIDDYIAEIEKSYETDVEELRDEIDDLNEQIGVLNHEVTALKDE